MNQVNFNRVWDLTWQSSSWTCFYTPYELNLTWKLHSLQEMLHLARGKSPGKMQKSLANGRLPGAKYPAKPLIANDHVRALALGKCAPSTGPGSTLGKLCLHKYRLLQAFADWVSITSVFFKICQGLCEGLTPSKMYSFIF